MAVPRPKIEIGFEPVDAGTGPYLRLDDPIKGKLDDANWVLSGAVLIDVTNRVKSFSISRGKNKELDTYEAGLANVVFNNEDRAFDPEFEDSPLFGQVVPRRAIRISSGNELLFFGVIDDWNLNYEPNNESTASAACSDAFSFFATQALSETSVSEQQTGARINEILSNASVAWPTDERNIETGIQTLAAETIPADTNVLEYLRQIAASEPGSIFIGRDGYVTFKDRYATASATIVSLSDDGTGIPYAETKVVYGSELLYNEIELASPSAGTAIATNQASIDIYGVRNLTQSNLLIKNSADLTALADWYATKYSQPEYRFDQVTIQVDRLTTAQQQQILALELGDVVEIKFTPNGIPPAIVKYGEIIRVDTGVDPVSHTVTLGFATAENALLVLDDLVFGRLDSGNVLAF